MPGLYDGVRQANTQFMSQYAGSIVPELAKYSEVVQDRYNKAADQDDALTEALGNLQHLNLDSDTQYANELKQNYYQKLQDRAGRGDFENMGRRTRRDAIQFSQAYQPLIQRQKDLSEIVKKVNSDANIADPQKKEQILGYIQAMNSTKRNADGDFERDASGKVNLGGIKDWAYAKDVDINKKLADLLSKKETDIQQSGFASDGQGLKISSVHELRSPAVMAKLAREMMSTDPEIKAMINRDVTLQNYRLSDEDVRASVAQIDKSPYALMKSKGMSAHDIAVQAKAQGVSVNDLKTSNIERQRQQYIAQGMSPAAANKAIWNKVTEQQMAAPHVNLIANLLAVDRTKLEAQQDGLLLQNRKHKLDQQDAADNEKFQILTTPVQQATQVDPLKVTKDYSDRQRATSELGRTTAGIVMAAMRKAGSATGDPKHDMAMATDITNNPTKLNALRDKLRNSDPELAGRLETYQKNYSNAKNELGYHEANTKALEQASGINFDDLYKTYRKNPTHSMRNNDEHLTKDQFVDYMRNGEHSGFFKGALSNATGFNEAYRQYTDKLSKGAEIVRTKKTQLNSFNPIQPLSNGYLKQATDGVEAAAKGGVARFRVLGEGNDKVQTLSDILGINPAKLKDPQSPEYTQMKNSGILINRNYVGGKPTVTITQPDGKTVVAQIESGIDPNLFREVSSHVIKQSLSDKNSDFARSQAADVLMGAGESTMQMSLNEVKSLSPSSVKYPINDMYEIKVKPGGPEGKYLELYIRGGGFVKKFTRTEDLGQTLGVDELQRTSPPKK